MRPGRNNARPRSGYLFGVLLYLPGFIYDRLPAIHVAAGISCVSSLDLRGPGGVSAVLLLAAGLLTAYWRGRDRWLLAGRQWPAKHRSVRRPGSPSPSAPRRRTAAR